MVNQYLCMEDDYKLDEARHALRQGYVKAISKHEESAAFAKCQMHG